ncbi:protein of unknown function (plasmid) [Azospirillum baldaniorum]|uniref:Uncharacterized protein n=1 Tax=Azospirillum baldaniorum TaxID=1064539 RepID=A0A9P1NQU8_9PROT|nr:protein of unknown function [Azospirillum baldaniorum]
MLKPSTRFRKGAASTSRGGSRRCSSAAHLVSWSRTRTMAPMAPASLRPADGAAHVVFMILSFKRMAFTRMVFNPMAFKQTAVKPGGFRRCGGAGEAR